MARKLKKNQKKMLSRPRRGGVPTLSVTKAENYLSYGLTAHGVGNASGASGTGSLAFNDYLLNAGAQIQLGTGVNLRLGKHIFLTRLVVRLSAAMQSDSRLRVIIAKNTREVLASTATTNTALTAFVEGPELLETPLQIDAGALVIDKMVSPSTDYAILHDCIYGTDTGCCVSGNGASGFKLRQIDIEVPLALQRTYDNSGNPDMGGWFIYFVTGDGTASHCDLNGYMRVEYVNQWNFESIGRGIQNAITAADGVLTAATSSRAVQAAFRYAPMIFGM
jgi:hypothetical protein